MDEEELITKIVRVSSSQCMAVRDVAILDTLSSVTMLHCSLAASALPPLLRGSSTSRSRMYEIQEEVTHNSLPHNRTLISKMMAYYALIRTMT